MTLTLTDRLCFELYISRDGQQRLARLILTKRANRLIE